MATTQDRDIKNDAKVALRHISFARSAVPASQAALLIGSFQPGYAFEIVSVQHLAKTVTATASYQLKIGTTNATSATTPTAATRGNATLTAGALQGDEDDVINLHATTNGSGAFADLEVIVTIRPLGLRGDA